jgi:pyruvate kinase
MADEIRFVGDLARLELKPGDRFVLTTSYVLHSAAREHIQRAWEDFTDSQPGDIKLLILDSGMKLGVVNTGEPAAEGGQP